MIAPAPHVPAPLPPLVVTADEAARLLSVSNRTLFDLVRDGLPCIRIGHGPKAARRFAVRDLEAWIERQSRSTRPAATEQEALTK